MPRISVNGVQLAYDEEGTGAPLVMVHGSWTNRHGFDRVAPALAERFRVIRHDRRGHSESAPATGTLDDDVEDILALAEALQAVPFHLACSSHGGVIGLRLASEHLDAVRSIVCHEPPLHRLVPEDAADWEALGAGLDDEARVVEMIEAGDAEAAARFFVEEVAFGAGAWEAFPDFMRRTFVENAATFAEEFRDPSLHTTDPDRLAGIHAPALLTTSADSPSWFGLVIDRLAKLLPNVEVHRYAAGGHNPQGTQPEQYVRVVGDFAARHGTGV